jgi:DNA modification methylase
VTTLPTPIYQSKRATLYCGDCLPMLPLLRGIDAVVSDPPYGVKFTYGAKQKSSGLVPPHHACHCNKPIHGDDVDFDPAPLLDFSGKKNMPIALCGGDHFAQRLPKGMFLTWDKSVGQGAAATFADAEIVWTNRRNARCIFRHFWMGAFRAGEDGSSKQKRLHVSQKPVELMAWLLDTIRVGLGKTVIDPYMGSASTGVACLRTGRKFVGIDIDAENCANAVERIRRIEAEIEEGLKA